MIVLGIMSGTSMDGVDYALCDIDARRCKLIELWSARFPAALQRRLQAATASRCHSHETAQLHHDLGRFYAKHATKARRAGLVGLHGQTLFHNPEPKAPATLQIGEPAYLVESLQVPVVSNFRAADIAAGGQGAPLATAFHLRVFGDKRRTVCVNNLGGISNVTYIERGDPSSVLAFDTGPANVLIDLSAQHFSKGRHRFDRNGALARCGAICAALVEKWLEHPYFQKRPPKSTGRELFGERFFASALADANRRRLAPADLLATVTEFTVRSIARSYEAHLPSMPDEVILCGGGAANAFLVSRLQSLLGSIKVSSCKAHGWPLQSIEPAAFALLAWLRWNRLPGNLPATTGARQPAILGQISLP